MSLDLLNPIDRDALRQQYQGGKPVPWFKIDNFLRADFADQCAAAFPTYDDVAKVGKTWNNVNEKGKYQVTDSSLFPPPEAVYSPNRAGSIDGQSGPRTQRIQCRLAPPAGGRNDGARSAIRQTPVDRPGQIG